MIVRSWDQLEESGRQARCTACRLSLLLDDIHFQGDETPMSACCRVPVSIPDSATLAERRGPAWATFVATPAVLLASRFTFQDEEGERRELNASTKLVAIALLDWLDLPAVFPSHETLAEQTGLSSRTVRRAIRELALAGLLRRSRRLGPGGHRRSDLLDLSPLVEALNDLAANPAARSSNAGPNGQVVTDLAANLAGGLAAKLAEDLDPEGDLEPDEIERHPRADLHPQGSSRCGSRADGSSDDFWDGWS